MTQIEVFAPAKINLTLHVTGQRPDGYHLLDSLVCFADFGDSIVVKPADKLSLTIKGPFGAQLEASDDNLVLRAARLLDPTRGAEITLIKRLPVASGIGGGSADAAASLRALAQLWGLPLPSAQTVAALGADVPVCLRSSLSRMQGVGEKITHMGSGPNCGVILVNPGVAISTPSVFKALASKQNPLMTEPLLEPSDEKADLRWLGWLAQQRNDLEPAAIAQEPVIAEVLENLRALPGVKLARMSGSGATCFALADLDVCAGLDGMRDKHPDWWIVETKGLPYWFDGEHPGKITAPGAVS